MLRFDVNVSGSDVGEALVNDIEEAAYAIVAFAGGLSKSDHRELTDYLQTAAFKGTEERKKVVAFAALLLDAYGELGQDTADPKDAG